MIMNNTDPTIKGILEDVEQTAQNFEYCSLISDKFAPAIDRAREIGDTNTEKKLLWEYQLFRFVTKTETGKPEKNRRFYPMMTATTKDGQLINIPEIEDFTDEAIEYLKERANETRNPILKSRYADFVWELKKDKLFGKAAVEAYLETAEDFYKKSWFFRLNDVFDRCIYLAMLKVVDENRFQEIKRRLLDYIARMIEDNHHRFCLELSDSFLQIMRQKVKEEEYEQVLKIISQCAEYFAKQNNFSLQRLFLERSEKLTNKYGHPDLAQNYKEQQAQSYLAEAEFQESNNNSLVAASLFESAIKLFLQLGDKEKVNFYKTKFIEANKKSLGQLKEIRTEVKYSATEIKQFADIILSAKDLTEALGRLSVFDNLLPNYQSIVALTQKMQKEMPLQFLISRRTIGQNGHLLSAGADPSQDILMRNLVLGIEIASVFRNTIFKRLCREKGLNHETLANYLKNRGLIDDQNFVFIEHGIKKHFEEDYISSIHILVPQLEAVIRKLFKKGGIQTISFVRGTTYTQETPLNELLEREEVKAIIGENLWWYTYLILVSSQGYNLRNEVAHGLIEIKKCNLAISNLILHLYILFTRFQIINK